MTRIVLRPRVLPSPQGRCELFGDWHWWRLRARGDVIQRYAPTLGNIETATLEFDTDIDPDTELVNPPVMRVLRVQRMTDLMSGGAVVRTMLDAQYTEIFVVWEGSPGERWQQLPGNTCRPGNYETVEETDSRRERDGWSDMYEARFEAGMRRLAWNPRPTLSVAEAEQMLEDLGSVYEGQLDDTLVAYQRAEREARDRALARADETVARRARRQPPIPARDLDLDNSFQRPRVNTPPPRRELDLDEAEEELRQIQETAARLPGDIAAAFGVPPNLIGPPEGFQPVGYISEDDVLIPVERGEPGPSDVQGLFQQIQSAAESVRPLFENLASAVEMIGDAMRAFTEANRYPPSAVLLHPSVVDQLRRLADQDEIRRGLYLRDPAPAPSGIARVMGLEVIADRNMPTDQILVVSGADMLPPGGRPIEFALTPSWGNPARQPREPPQTLPPQTARVEENPDGSRTYTFDAPNGTFDGVVFPDGTEVDFTTVTMAAPGQVICTVTASPPMVLPDGQPRLRIARTQVRAIGADGGGGYARQSTTWRGGGGGAGMGILSPDEIRQRELPPPPVSKPLVLPEAEVIDEIDRLVNEQVAPGPRDDYNVNRYPDCDECGHDWHGLECEECECINTDWLNQPTSDDASESP